MTSQPPIEDQPINPDDPRGLLASLTEAQQAAVTHGRGPLLIVAGAGTGKTTVLTKRIEWLIDTKRAKPSEILALTFTEKAAAEMETRLDVALPLGQSDVAIHTFHSFGRRILEEEAVAAQLPADFSVLSETEQQIFLSDRLAKIEGLEHFQPLGNPFKFVESIVKLISRAKDELISAADYSHFADESAISAKTEDERVEAARQRELATIYAYYETWKHEAGMVDYGDLITQLVKLFRARPDILARTRKRFHYIVVDEFQDTNVAQYELIKILLDKNKNLTIVADDDQAIYKFRGAAVSNILGFVDDFPDTTQVVLTDNFRSSQSILDAAYRLIQHNNPDRLEAKLGIDKHLVSHRSDSESPSVTLDYLASESDEAAATVSFIQTQHEAGIPWHEIAVLARSNTILDDLARVLAIAQIPFVTSSDRTFALRPEIRGLIAFLKVLAHPTDSLSLLKLALSPFYDADPDWLLVFNDAVRARHQSLHEVLGDDSRPPWDRLPEAGRKMMLGIRDELSGYRRMISTHAVGDIVYRFLHDHGALAFESIEDQHRIANLAVMFEAIRSWSRASRDPHTLTFVDQLDQLVGSLHSPAPELGLDNSAVQLLTVHAAKGLEFDTVLLPSFIQGRFPGANRRDALPLPDQLIKERLPEGDEHLEEERRLAYVAMTRAKRTLRISAAASYGAGARTRKLSPFLAEALDLKSTPNPASVPGANRTSLFAITPTTQITQRLQYPEQDGVITLSPAKIECYLRCPNEFYWRYVLNAPSVPTAVLIYGNAVHAGIEAFHRARKELLSENPPLSKRGGRGDLFTNHHDRLVGGAIDQFQSSWQDEGFVSAKQAIDLKRRGELTLTRFVERNLSQSQPSRVESWVHLTLDRTISIRGRIDALWLTPEIEIRDYKTTERVTDEKAALRRAKANIPLLIYGYAIREETGRTPNRLTLDFVETNQLGVIHPTEEQLDSAAETIRTVTANIRAGKFNPNPDPRHPCDVCRKT